MAAGVKSLSKTFVWIIVALLIVGLAGFGATNLGGTIRTIGSVGDQPISVNAYARELQRELRAFEAQTGQPLTMEQARTMGLDRAVLARLVQLAALDHEAAQMGLSIGDENLQKEIVQIGAFQGVNGTFDRETYRYALEQANLTEAEFEDDLRAESARAILQGALVGGTVMPDPLADAMAGFIGARRSFTWAALDAEAMRAGLPEPTEEDLRSYYEANTGDFTLPETKRLTYALLTPEMLLDTVELDEADVRALYDERGDQYNLPERRLIERLVFADQDAASEAKAQLEVGGTTFEALVDARGLALSDIDLGDVTPDDLDEAAEAVFAAAPGDVVGPLPSALGPALFRVNGVLEARTTAFEEVRDELRDELAGERARRQIETRADPLEDILAGGATLEDLARETEMELGQVDWTPDGGTGVAAYQAFGEAAADVAEGDFPEIAFLEDGGLFALRLDEVLPPRPEPFDQAREAVTESWYAAETAQALGQQAETLIADLTASGDFLASGLETRVENGLTRSAFIDNAPADLMAQVFEMEPGELRVVSGPEGTVIVRLDEVLPPAETPEQTAMREALGQQLDQDLAQALFAAFLRDAQRRARPRIDDQALAAVNASFN